MRLALFVSILSSVFALNAETIQGKVVRVSDGDIKPKVNHYINFSFF